MNDLRPFEKLPLNKLLIYLISCLIVSIGVFLYSQINKSQDNVETRDEKRSEKDDSYYAKLEKERDYFKGMYESQLKKTEDLEKEHKEFLLSLWEDSKKSKKHAQRVENGVDRVVKQSAEKIGNITEEIKALPKTQN